MGRFTKMGVCEYVCRETARRDPIGETARVKWGRVGKGSEDNPEVRCRGVAQELGFGERLDEPSARHAERNGCKATTLGRGREGRTCPWCCWTSRARSCTGACGGTCTSSSPTRTRCLGAARPWGSLRRWCAVLASRRRYGPTHAGRRSWAWDSMQACFTLQSVWHALRRITAVVHVEDVLHIGDSQELRWLFEALQKGRDLNNRSWSR